MHTLASRLTLFALCAVLVGGCTTSKEAVPLPMPVDTEPVPELPSTEDIRPVGPPPAWAPDIDPQMLAALERLEAFGQSSRSEMTAAQARAAKSLADAAAALLQEAGVPTPAPAVEVAQQILPIGPSEGLLVRTYRPRGAVAPLPVIVYYHGGDWMTGDLDAHEPTVQALSEQVGALVLAVAYRQAPEHIFSTAHEDALAAYTWTLGHAAIIGGDSSRVAVAGEGAGGGLALAVPLMASEQDVPSPAHVLAVYPMADSDTVSTTYRAYAEARPLGREALQRALEQYLPRRRDKNSPWVAFINADFADYPPTTIITAELDPLRGEGEELARQLRQDGVDVQQQTFCRRHAWLLWHGSALRAGRRRPGACRRQAGDLLSASIRAGRARRVASAVDL